MTKEQEDALLNEPQPAQGYALAEARKSRDAYLEDSRQSREYIMELKGQLKVAEAARDNFRTLLIELCEKMEAGLSGAEETKRARTMLSNSPAGGVTISNPL